MRTFTKLTMVGLLVASLMLVMGCGSDNERVVSPNQDVVTGPNGTVTTFVGQSGATHELVSSPQNGEFVGVGVERPETMQDFSSVTDITFSNKIHWYTRIEFLTQSGAKVDPNSFNKPAAQFHNVRITLESTVRPGLRLSASGTLWFAYKTGSIQGGQYLMGKDSEGKNIIIHFSNRNGNPANFQLWDFFQTSGGSTSRTVGIATIVVEDGEGRKHFLVY